MKDLLRCEQIRISDVLDYAFIYRVVAASIVVIAVIIIIIMAFKTLTPNVKRIHSHTVRLLPPSGCVYVWVFLYIVLYIYISMKSLKRMNEWSDCRLSGKNQASAVKLSYGSTNYSICHCLCARGVVGGWALAGLHVRTTSESLYLLVNIWTVFRTYCTYQVHICINLYVLDEGICQCMYQMYTLGI